MRLQAHHILFFAIGHLLISLISPFTVDGSLTVPRQEQSSQLVRRFLHGSFIIENTLYIDGGEETRSIDDAIDHVILNSTLAIDLTSSFSTSLKNNSINVKTINKGSCPNFNYITFWIDTAAKIVYAYGGEFSYLNPWLGGATVPLESLWYFDPTTNGGSWQSQDQSSLVFASITRPTYGSAASGDIGGFNLGGSAGNHVSQKTDIAGYIPIPGLQFYNFTSQIWLNDSATRFSPDGTAAWSGSAYVPTWGVAGLLVLFGGQISPNISQYVDGAYYRSMSNISLFDPSTQSWYWQDASGNIPTQRDRFCVVGTSGGDNSSYEIFVYGGQVGAGIYDGSRVSQNINAGLDEVYILSLPSFMWFKANYTSSDPRIFHTCDLVGNRQMLSIGGLDPSATNASVAWNDTDPFWEGMKVFDLTDLRWTNHYNVNAQPYVPPTTVAAHYASGSRYPSTWSNHDLESLFMRSKSNDSASGQSSAMASAQSKPLPQTKSHTAAIIGGIMGGAGGVAIGGLVIFLLLRTRRRARREQEQATLPSGLKDDEPDLMQRNVQEAGGQAIPYEKDSNILSEMPDSTDARHESVHEI